MPRINYPRSCFFVLQFVCIALVVIASTAAVFSQTPRKIAFTYGSGATHIAVIPLTTTFLAQTSATRVALFSRFVDLAPGEDLSVVSVKGLTPQQVEHDLPVEFVGKVPGMVGQVPSDEELTQINVRLPADLPVGDLFVRLIFRGKGSELVRIRIK